MRVFSLILTIIGAVLSTSAQEDISIPYLPDHMITAATCNGDPLRAFFNFDYIDGDVELKIVKSSLKNPRLKYGDEIRDLGETLRLPEGYYGLEVISTLYHNVKEPTVSIQAKVGDQMIQKDLKIVKGYFTFKDAELIDGVYQIDVSRSCVEEFYVAFPSIATQNDYRLSKLEGDNYRGVEANTYYASFEGYFRKFTKKDLGQYQLSIQGCWGNDTYKFMLK